MGQYLSIQKKKSPGTALEELEKKINFLENRRQNIYNRHKFVLEQFLTSSVATYIVCLLLFYNFFYPETMFHKVIAYIVIILSPGLIATIKKAITWFYKVQMARTDDHIDILENEKIKILDGIIKTESYLEAKRYFDRYAPRHKKKLGFPIKLESSEKIVPKNICVLRNAKTEKYGGSQSEKSTGKVFYEKKFTDMQVASSSIRDTKGTTYSGKSYNRCPTHPEDKSCKKVNNTEVQEFNNISSNHTETEINSISLDTSNFKKEVVENLNKLVNTYSKNKVQEIRNNLSKLPQRFVFDQLVDYLSGDGPSSRYALICMSCARHNGMALKEDFEYISFKCCYCDSMNPARKIRVPTLEYQYEDRQEEKEKVTEVTETEVLYSKCEEYNEMTESETKLVKNN